MLPKSWKTLKIIKVQIRDRTGKMGMKLINKILFRLNLHVTNPFPRPSIHFIKSYFKGKPIIGAEIGTYSGFNAKSILKELNLEKLYLIDPYKEYGNYTGEVEKAKRFANLRLRKWIKQNKAVFVYDFSSNAVEKIPVLDFVYIDGNHEHKYVKEDIRNYWGKIKKRGIMAGHDFNNNSPGVIKAVLEFAKEYKISVHVKDPDWWIIK